MNFRRIHLNGSFDKDVIQEMNKDMWEGIFLEFLDDFYAHWDLLPKDYFVQEPRWGKNFSYKQKVIFACHIHKLTSLYRYFIRPKWIFKKFYYSKEPIFACDAKGRLRLYLLLFSEPCYKCRNCFLGSPTLQRC